MGYGMTAQQFRQTVIGPNKARANSKLIFILTLSALTAQYLKHTHQINIQWQVNLRNKSTAPHVTGVAALIRSACPHIGAAEIKSAIMAGVDVDSSTSGSNSIYDKCVSKGRLNAYKALQAARHNSNIKYSVSGNFTGKGDKNEIAALYDDGMTAGIQVWSGNGSEFLYKLSWWSTQSVLFDTSCIKGIAAGDFNGDGKDDVAVIFNNNVNEGLILVWKSAGTHFIYEEWWRGWYDATCVRGVAAGRFSGHIARDNLAIIFNNM